LEKSGLIRADSLPVESRILEHAAHVVPLVPAVVAAVLVVPAIVARAVVPPPVIGDRTGVVAAIVVVIRLRLHVRLCVVCRLHIRLVTVPAGIRRAVQLGIHVLTAVIVLLVPGIVPAIAVIPSPVMRTVLVPPVPSDVGILVRPAVIVPPVIAGAVVRSAFLLEHRAPVPCRIVSAVAFLMPFVVPERAAGIIIRTGHNRRRKDD